MTALRHAALLAATRTIRTPQHKSALRQAERLVRRQLSQEALSQNDTHATSHRPLPKIQRKRYTQISTHFYQNRILDPYVSKAVQKVSLRQLAVFGRTMSDEKLLKSANYVRVELPVRLAHRIRDFQNLPFIVGTNPHVEKVYELYWTAFDAIRKVPEIKTMTQNKEFCKLVATLLDEHLTVIPQLTLGISECAASGILDPRVVDNFMNGVLRSRVSRRVIAEQHINLTAQWTHWDDCDADEENILFGGKRKWEDLVGARTKSSDQDFEWAARAVGAGLIAPPTHWEGHDSAFGQSTVFTEDAERNALDGKSRHATSAAEEVNRFVSNGPTVGIICTAVHAGSTAMKCAKMTADSIREAYGVEPPRVIVDGHTSATFTYIPDHIEFILFELLKNSMRATLELNERQGGARSPTQETTATEALPPIRITVCQGDEDIVYRISDRGGGIPRKVFDNLWSFSHITTSKKSDPSRPLTSPMGTFEATTPDCSRSPKHTPRFLATARETIPHFGLGLGLNMSKVYTNYWGGNLSLHSVWGYGTDAYVRISRLGNQSENLKFEET